MDPVLNDGRSCMHNFLLAKKQTKHVLENTRTHFTNKEAGIGIKY